MDGFILISAFECNPYRGSDAYVGWSYAKELASFERVVVFTSLSNKKDIENFLKNEKIPNLEFVFFDSDCFMLNILKGRIKYFYKYLLWQKKAYLIAKKKYKKDEIRVIHHVSIADFRVIGKLWKLKTPFVFGPVGGAQTTPDVLKKYVKKYRIKEFVRECINWLFLHSFNYKKAINKASFVFFSNEETQRYVISKYKNIGNKSRIMCELGISNQYLMNRENLIHTNNDVVHILYSGRLMYRKGFQLLLDSLPKISTNHSFVLDVYGGGHEENEYKKIVEERKLQNIVIFHGIVDYQKMQSIYQKSDLLVFPSLRETTGTSLLESMANKLPIVSLNQNGGKYLIGNDAGILVPVDEKIVDSFAQALSELIDNYDKRIVLGTNGYNKVKEKYTWRKKVLFFSRVYKEIKGVE